MVYLAALQLFAGYRLPPRASSAKSTGQAMGLIKRSFYIQSCFVGRRRATLQGCANEAALRSGTVAKIALCEKVKFVENLFDLVLKTGI